MVKLKGTTIIEVLVAMASLLICTTMATSIYLNILRNESIAEKTNAYLKLKDLCTTIEKEKNFLDKEWEENGFSYSKTCKPYKDNNSIIVLKLEVKNQSQKKIGEFKKIIVSK
ncbi:MAG: hypothetical protein ACXVPN_10365 [Bacteroidia bacterium]